jgi:hypothetical protein
VTPFIHFFAKTSRLATLDISSGSADDLWVKVMEFFSELDLKFMRKVDNVLLFTFSKY